VIAILLVCAFAAVAFGGDADEEKREVKMDFSSNSVKYESKTQLGKTKNKYQVQYDAEDGRLRISFAAYAKDTDSTTEELFQVKFEVLQEYVETDGVPGLSSGDTLGRTYNLGKEAAQTKITFIRLPDGTAWSGDAILNFEARTTDGVFVLRSYIAPVNITLGKLPVAPDTNKFDIFINNFAFTLSNSRLAIIAKVRSKDRQGYRAKDSDGVDTTTVPSKRKTEVNFGVAALPFARFTWATTCTVPVNASADIITSAFVVDVNDTDRDADESNKRVAFSIDSVQPSSVFWDPAVGMGASNGAGRIPVASTMIAAVSLVSMLLRSLFV